MKTCINCFKSIPDDALFCPYCGYPQDKVDIKRCAAGHLIFVSWKDCPFCAQERVMDRTVLENDEMTVLEADSGEATVLESDETLLGEDLAETKLDLSRVGFFAWLVKLVDGKPTEDYRITEERIFLGRAPSSDIVVDDDLVSKQHAAIYFKNGEFIIDDLNSKNGTFLNGELVERAKLSDGDIIRLGETEFIFKILR